MMLRICEQKILKLCSYHQNDVLHSCSVLNVLMQSCPLAVRAEKNMACFKWQLDVMIIAVVFLFLLLTFVQGELPSEKHLQPVSCPEFFSWK